MTTRDVPVRPDGVELIGELEGSGYRTPPALVRRHDGQTLQLTPLLYAVLEAVDGRRDLDDIADAVATRTGRRLSARDVRTLVEERLRPMGLVLGVDGSLPELERSNPLLGLRLKVAITDPEVTRRVTGPFTVLFHPLVWVPVVVVFAWLAWWVLMERGLAAATYQAFAKPGLLLVILAITILSAGFHEFGHAAAARRGGARPGIMGAGLYLLWPAFYTDVTDSYRLGRLDRIRTDLGGLYFNAIVAVGILGVWLLTSWDAVLLLVAVQVLQMIRQLLPLVRFDGYHVLADLIGVPDLFSRIGPILGSFLPWRRPDPRVAQLKWWARLAVALWVVTVVPLLLFTVVIIVLAMPRLVGTALESLGREQAAMAARSAAGQHLEAVAAGVAMVLIALPIGAVAILLVRLVRAGLGALWRRTEGRPARRAGAAALVGVLAMVVALAWWPEASRYRPIRPYEPGTLLAVAIEPLAAAGVPVPTAPPTAGGEVAAVLPASATLPDESAPRLAVVLVPTDGSTDGAPAWVFPFDRPLPPDPGDNQATAVNTTDGTAAYRVAIAMVWVTGDEPVLNTNEAYAFASCADCVTVAVAFQVVLILGSADVIVPQNLSAAVNYECFECITTAIASQLVVTLDGDLGEAERVALADLWAEISAFAATIPTLTLADVISQLEGYKARILAILGQTPVVPASPVPSGWAQPSWSPSPSSQPSPSGGPTGTALPTEAAATLGPETTTPAGSSSPAVASPQPSTPPPSAGPEPSGSPSASPSSPP